MFILELSHSALARGRLKTSTPRQKAVRWCEFSFFTPACRIPAVFDKGVYDFFVSPA